MYKVVVKKAQGKKLKVWTNMYGEPVGDTRQKLQSYIGMLARTMILIDIESWPKADREFQNNLWTDVEVNKSTKDTHNCNTS